MDFKIGSFNTKNLNFASDKDVRKEFEQMGEFLKAEAFDIIALQEVMSPNALEYLVHYMGDSVYDKRFEQSRSKSKVSNEGYAFIWDKRRIGLASKTVTYSTTGVPVEPRIINQYRTDSKFRSQGLIRNPYYGRFTPVNLPACEIRLINTHIMYDKSAQVKDVTDYTRLEMRKKELEILTTQIYRRISEDHSDNCKTVFAFLLGDYNMNLPTLPKLGDYMEDSISVDDNGHIMTINTVQDQLTTLRVKTDESAADSDESIFFRNNYDHFSYTKDRYDNRDINISVYHINAVRKYFQNDYEKYNKTISDHIPIAMELTLR